MGTWFDYNDVDAKINANRNRWSAPAATNTGDRPGDTLAPQAKFTDVLRNDPNMNWASAFGMGMRGTVDQGISTGALMNALAPKSDVPAEAMRKMDYAAEQLHPIAHTIGRIGGAGVSAADYVISALDGAAALKALSKLGSKTVPAAEGAIGAWTNASTALQNTPGWLPRIGSALVDTGKAFARNNPIATVVGGGGLGALIGNIAANNYNGTGEQYQNARDKKAAQEQAAAQASRPSGPDPTSVTIAQFLDQMEPPEYKARYDLNPRDPAAAEAYGKRGQLRAANTQVAREAIAVGKAMGLDPETTLTLVKRGQFTNDFISTMMGYQAQRTSRPVSLKDALGAQQMQAIDAIRAEAASMPEGKERKARENLADQMLKELMQMVMAPSTYVPMPDDQQDQ